jgi:hypothetical protein
LREQAAQPFREETRDEIGGAAGCEADHQPDRPVGKILCLCAVRHRQDDRGGDNCEERAPDDDHGTKHSDGACRRHSMAPS